MIRALHIINSLAAAGAETLLVQLCRRLPEQGVEPTVASLLGPGPLSPLLAQDRIPTVDLSRGGRFDVAAVLKLAAAIRRHRIDVVHTHLVYAGIVGKLAAVATGRPVISTRHYMADPRERTLPFRLEDRLTTSCAARVVAITDCMREAILAQRLVEPERVAVHRNAIDLDLFISRIRPSSRREGTLVGTIGRMEPPKAQEVYLEAMSLVRRCVPSVRGILVGDGRRREELLRLRAQFALGDVVTFSGSVPPDEIPSLLAGFDVFVLSSNWEGLPMVLIEAQAAGVPIVATAVGGVPEVVHDGATGLLVPPRDPTALAGAIVRLLEDQALRWQLGVNAAAHAEREFDIRRLARQTAAMYREVLAERKRA